MAAARVESRRGPPGRPGEEFQDHAKIVTGRQVAHGGEPVGLPNWIGIIGSGDGPACTELRAYREEGFRPGDVDIGGDADELDIVDRDSGISRGVACRTQQGRVRHQRIERRLWGDLQ